MSGDSATAFELFKLMILIIYMNGINSDIDLNLLCVFVLLMQERSVSRVAERLGRGQPAVSHALGRLRTLMGDPLFIRAGRAMEPTPRALTLFDDVAPSMDALEAAVRAAQSFDPLSDDRTFRIALSDDLQMAYLPAIAEHLARVMPRAKLVVVQSDYRTAAQILERKTASLVIGYLDHLPAAAKIRKVRRVGYRVLRAGGEGGISRDPLSLDAYCQQTHILVTFAGDLVGYIDETLETLNRKRNICLSVPAFAVLPYVQKNTHHLATVPAYVADTLAQTPGLTSEPLPFKSPEFDLSMAWAAATDRDPAEQFLRKCILAILQEKTGR